MADSLELQIGNKVRTALTALKTAGTFAAMSYESDAAITAESAMTDNAWYGAAVIGPCRNELQGGGFRMWWMPVVVNCQARFATSQTAAQIRSSADAIRQALDTAMLPADLTWSGLAEFTILDDGEQVDNGAIGMPNAALIRKYLIRFDTDPNNSAVAK